jgi:hypothetical protein
MAVATKKTEPRRWSKKLYRRASVWVYRRFKTNQRRCVFRWLLAKRAVFSSDSDFSTFRQPISQTALPILAQIKATNSVCVHARRGDYLTNKRYVVLEMDYYRRAIKTLSSQFTNLHFFVFSDDIDWCKVNFEADCNCTFVSDNQRFMLRDEFEMMQNCQHHITANSTLSWWAAWLNKNHVKVVICPQKWFFDAKSTQDLIPQTWIQL